MRITAKQIETLGTMIPTVSKDGNFSFGLSQPKGKSSLRVQDGKLTYKLRADGTIAGTMLDKTEPATASS
jgi:hypothetical protein